MGAQGNWGWGGVYWAEPRHPDTVLTSFPGVTDFKNSEPIVPKPWDNEAISLRAGEM